MQVKIITIKQNHIIQYTFDMRENQHYLMNSLKGDRELKLTIDGNILYIDNSINKIFLTNCIYRS